MNGKTPRQLKLHDYEGFVEKFKPKLTTDDCYTPQPFYDALMGWLRENIPAVRDASDIVRPFWPGGDYEAADYPEGVVVVDNPPFSILAKIVDFYTHNGIRFWLFAPALTFCTTCTRPGVTAVVVDVRCTYENGAVVDTGFLTNCWPGSPAIAVSTTLHDLLEAEDKARRNARAKKKKAIEWPANVASGGLLNKAVGGGDFVIPREEAAHVRSVNGCKVFGSGFIVSDQAAADIASAIAAARAARAARGGRFEVRLSEAEKEVVRILTERGKKRENR